MFCSAHRSRRLPGQRAALAPLLTLATLVGAGCQATPSFELRWELARAHDETAAVPVLDAKRCSEMGVAFVQMRVMDAVDGAEVGRRVVPCFEPEMADADFLVAGPSLDVSGAHLIELLALDRDGVPWATRALRDPVIPAQTGFTVLSADLDGGRTTRIDAPVTLTTPPECADGIDNDLDGLIDGVDNACLADGTAPEAADFSLSQIVASVSFFDDSNVFRCGDVDIAEVVVRIVDEVSETRLELTSACPDGRVNFGIQNIALAEGSYTLQAVALNDQGEPLTETLTEAFEVKSEDGVVVVTNFDFSANTFVPALEAPVSMAFLVQDSIHQCAPVPSIGGNLVLDTFSFRVTDVLGDPVDAAAFDIDGTILPDGTLETPCTTNPINGPSVTWGNYEVEATFHAGGVACFTTESSPLAPRKKGNPQAITVERILEDGVVPAGCEECFQDSDCVAAFDCVGGVCDIEGS